uniref:IBB domain-containing protein n=1 Tax=Timema cristinae TaxID=61476 RepID=A0A7R9GWZ5_TIMCR|nr:unnamed protein product [Timema cristinae]
MPLITQDENNAVASRLQSFKNKGKNVDFQKRDLRCSHFEQHASITISSHLHTFCYLLLPSLGLMLISLACTEVIQLFQEMRRRRNEVNIELRKARKDDQLLKRRNICVDEMGSPLQENNGQTIAPIMSIQQIMEGMDSSDETKQLTATQAARKTLSRERNPPIDAMIESGIVPKCVDFLTHYQNPSLQFEASWALTNIASGTTEQTNAVVQQGAVPKFINLLASPYMHVAEQAVWALGNIAGDGPVARDLVLGLGALPALIELIKPDTNESLMRNIVWTLSNLCRNKNPPPPFDCIKPCLPVLNKLLYSQDKDVLADACWALSYVTDGSNDKIQAVVDNGVVPRLVELLSMEEVGVLTPALRAVGNIVTGNDLQASNTSGVYEQIRAKMLPSVLSKLIGIRIIPCHLNLKYIQRIFGAVCRQFNVACGRFNRTVVVFQTDSIIHAGALSKLSYLLKHSRSNIMKEAAWTVSNITAGNVDQIQHVVNSGLLQPLIDVLSSGDFKSQKEAAWAVTNYTSGSSPHQLVVLLQLDILKPFCNLLDSKDGKTVQVVLDGVSNILQTADKMNEVERVAIMIEECGGLDKLEALQNHENEAIYQKALNIIDNFFSESVSSIFLNYVLYTYFCV